MNKEEIKEFLQKEIDACNSEIKKAGELVEASLDSRKYYTRRREYLLKLNDLNDN